MHACIHIYIRTYVHTYVHTYIHMIEARDTRITLSLFSGWLVDVRRYIDTLIKELYSYTRMYSLTNIYYTSVFYSKC
jgi:hypothetical protein